jgi:hypothetical protein
MILNILCQSQIPVTRTNNKQRSCICTIAALTSGMLGFSEAAIERARLSKPEEGAIEPLESDTIEEI